MMFPLILSQGQNLSLLNTSKNESIIQLISQISTYLESHQIDSSQVLKN
jgi:hypothetical protein